VRESRYLSRLAGRRARSWHTGELAPVSPDLVARVDPDMVFAAGWDEATGGRINFGYDAMPGLPYRGWPGVAGRASRSGDPDRHGLAAALHGTARPHQICRGALPWLGPCGRRGGEHLAFCNDLAHLVDFGDHAETLVSAGILTFWWD
jgi:hypothetical protein